MIEMTYPSEEDWREARFESVGASESPALLGCGYSGQTPLTLYQQKTAPVDDDGLNQAFVLGRCMEEGIREAFSIQEGLDVVNPKPWTTYRHEHHKRVTATPDGFIFDDLGQGCLEAKYVGLGQVSEWDEGPPDRVWIQLQQQLVVTGCDFGWIVAACGTELHATRHEIDREFCSRLIETIEAFWALVQNRVEPIPGALPCDGVALKLLHPQDNGETINLRSDQADLYDDLIKYKDVAKQAKQAVDRLSNHFKSLMGDNKVARLPDGRGISWKTIDSQIKAKAAHVRTSRIFLLKKEV